VVGNGGVYFDGRNIKEDGLSFNICGGGIGKVGLRPRFKTAACIWKGAWVSATQEVVGGIGD